MLRKPLLPLLVLLAAGCAQRSPAPHADSPPGGATASVASARDSAVLLPIDAAGLARRVADGNARATLVNMWASWCVPCREEFPALVAVAKRHRAEGLRLLLVSGDFSDQLSPARRFLTENGGPDTSFYKDEADMQFINAVHPKWSGAIPATLLYDAHGRLLDFWEGGADSAQFERAVTNALAAKGDPS